MRRRTKMNSAAISEIKRAVSLAKLVENHVGTVEKHGREFLALCPFHREDTPSFRVYADHYHCFGCGEHGDIIDWLMSVERMSFEGVVRHLQELGGMPDPDGGIIDSVSSYERDWSPAVPVPREAPALILGNGYSVRIYNPKRAGEPKEWTILRPQIAHQYRDAEGQLLGYVLRCSFASGKKFTPCVTFCRHKDTGESCWAMVPFARPRPLYGLDRLAQHPDRAVVLVEGEATADAANRLLPHFVSATWSGGAKGYAHADWRPLAGRNVICIPDADDEGRAAFQGRTAKTGKPIAGIIDIITSLGANVRYVSPPASLADGWDLADGEKEAWSPAETLGWVKANMSEVVRHAA